MASLPIRSAAFFLLLGSLACSGQGAGKSEAESAKGTVSAQGAAAQSTEERGFSEAVELAIKEGEFNEARDLVSAGLKEGKQEAPLYLARLQMLVGEYESLASQSSLEPRMLYERVRAHRHLGQLDEALSLLNSVEPENSISQIRLDLLEGEILLELGRREEAEKTLVSVVSAGLNFESKEIEEKGHAFSLAGRASHLLREAEAANAAFNQAEQTGFKETKQLLLWRAELFLEKNDAAHAEEVLEEVEKEWPHDPGVMILYAKLWLEQALAFKQAGELARGVLEINPRHTGALALLAGNHLRDMDFSEAEKIISQGLKTNPRDLLLLSLYATSRFLAEDPGNFQKTVDRVLELSPGNTEVFRVVATYAEWEHRYPDIEKLMRRAIRLDRQDGRLRALLGLTLVRAGSDAAGIVELGRAHELDPFNVRVLNTLNLYEKNIPELYDDKRAGPFRYRFPKAESELLSRYVPQLLEQAHIKMVARYGYTPQAPIGIEIYSSRDEFAVRTGGLPRTAIQGVCFGRKLATMSPIGSPGNLGMTLWHELAHVFHLGLSKNRTPRWLTEGMAEWETAHRKIGWSRELDLELVQALRAERVPHLDSMSRAFTHATHMQDVATAYYASGLIAEWIVSSRGEAAAVGLFSELGKKRLATEVVPEVLGKKSKELDEEFREFLSRKLSRFQKQFVSRQERRSSEEIQALLKDKSQDREKRLSLGLSYLGEGKLKEAEETLTSLNQEKYEPQAVFALARIALASEEKKKAQRLLGRMLKEKSEGFEIRIFLARVALSLRQQEEALSQLKRATELDPDAEEAWSLLAALHHKREEREQELGALRSWARLSEHDPVVHRRLIELLLEQGQVDEARSLSDKAIWTDLAGFETHRLAGAAHARGGDLKSAEFEWESALLCPTRKDADERLQEEWLQELKKRGLHRRASETKKRLEGSREERLKKSFAPVL